MPPRGLYIMLPMRVRETYPGVEDEVITLPEIRLPVVGQPGIGARPPDQNPVARIPSGFDFPVTDIEQSMPREIGNTPYPSSALKSSVTFHWTGDDATLPTTDADTAIWLRNMAEQHIRKDWGGGAKGSGIMYHEAIGRTGTSFILRDYEEVVWHSGNTEGNTTSRAILVMCSTQNPPTGEQLNAVRKRTVDFGTAVFPHSYWSATQCPGPDIRGLVHELRVAGYQ